MMSIFFNKGIQTSESFIVGAILAVGGGFLDAYTYFYRGKVFANAQTGNIVLVAINIAQKDYSNIIKYVIPIFCFFVGVIVAEIMKHILKRHKLHWRQYALIVEALVLMIVMTLPNDNFYNIIANSLVSFVCALQVECFRKMHSTPFATTMCTGNLRCVSENIFLYFYLKNKEYRDRAIRSFLIIVLFIFGAICSAVLTKLYNTFSIIFVIILLLISFVIMLREKL